MLYSFCEASAFRGGTSCLCRPEAVMRGRARFAKAKICLVILKLLWEKRELLLCYLRSRQPWLFGKRVVSWISKCRPGRQCSLACSCFASQGLSKRHGLIDCFLFAAKPAKRLFHAPHAYVHSLRTFKHGSRMCHAAWSYTDTCIWTGFSNEISKVVMMLGIVS